MKKALILLMITAMIMTVCACGKDTYDSEYDAILASVSQMNEASDSVTLMISTIWEIKGSEYAMKYITKMLEANDHEAFEHGFTDIYEKLTGKKGPAVFWTSDYGKEVLEYAKAFQKDYALISSLNTSLEEKIVAFKKSHSGDDHQNAMEHLVNYYAESSSYAQFALEPTGNLAGYNSSRQEFAKNLESLKKQAELHK